MLAMSAITVLPAVAPWNYSRDGAMGMTLISWLLIVVVTMYAARRPGILVPCF
jgi:hypothetical protein